MIRAATTADAPAIEALYPAAFPQEDLLPLLRDLSALDGVLSLVALQAAHIVGHVAFTPCGLDGTTALLALLGPLTVSPSLHRRGIGRALVEEGLARLRPGSVRKVLVLGDPAYYGRFGFLPEEAVAPPFRLPDAWRGAWQSLDLVAEGLPLRGMLVVPPPWRRAALWAP